MCTAGVLIAAGLGHGAAQDIQPARPLVTQAVDVSRTVQLSQARSSSAGTAIDRGVVDPSAFMGQMMLLLKRPAEREAALEKFLNNVQTTGGTEYHHWLTPDAFGQQFGPADTDVTAVSQWLQSQGLKVQSVSRSRQIIRFSGTVGGFNRAFSTRLERYDSNGSVHAAPAVPLHVPEALGKAVASVSLRGQSRFAAPIPHSNARASFHAEGGHPHWTETNSGTPFYALSPADLAVQYDLAPLYTAGVNGAGKIIGVLGVSNINTAEVDTFRSIFGVATGPVQVIVDGEDPGRVDDPTLEYHDVNDDPTVSYLGVETAGGLAPGAQIRLYVSAGSEYQDPLFDAAQRAVDDDQADVLSLGFDTCESSLIYDSYLVGLSTLWEQAAAQGQTVVVESGYAGSAGCGSPGQGDAANGLGSTPWNLSVGGTDFYYSDYASGGASASSLWNGSSDPVTKASLKAPLPEQVWNDVLGENAVPYQAFSPYWIGGGAPSSCGVLNDPPGSDFATCVSGWPKPAWQSGNGVPQDGVRDTPDVSMFAGDGQNFSAYAICEFAQDCKPDANGNFSADLVGGTSAAAPAMAAIMALVDQKYGRQGQAAPVFYALAKIAPSVFHDIAQGGNNVPCTLNVGIADCVANADGTASTPGFAAGAGYDLASGLGTIDAAQLVNHWSDATSKSSATTLQLSSLSFQHGQNITASVKVTGSDGGTPTGDVALTSASPQAAQQGQGFISLASGTGIESIGSLPGGSYQLTGRYGGDGVYGPSSSTPVSLTVTPETSQINFDVLLTGHYIGGGPFTPNTQAPYGAPVELLVQPRGTSGSGVATGSATFTLNTTTYNAALDAGGYGSWIPLALPVGQYTASATYSGDASFSSSVSTPLPFGVVQAIPFLTIDSAANSGTLHVGETLTIGVTVGNQQLQTAGTLPPTGQVQAILGDCQLYFDGKIYYQQTGTLSAPVGASSTVSSALIAIPNVGAGSYCIRVLYSGDNNYVSLSELLVNDFTVLPTAAIPTTTVLQVTPTTITAGQKTKLIGTVSGPAGSTIAPTGTVTFYDNGSDGNGYYTFYAELVPGTGGTSIAELSNQSATNFFNSGVNQMVAVYSGDSIYAPSTSATVSLTATQPGGDFKLEASQTTVTLAAGKSSSVALNLTALFGFTGTVNLACAPSSATATCSISPSSVALTNTGNATLSFNAYTTPAAGTSTMIAGLTALGGLLLLLWQRSRARWRGVALGIVGLMIAAASGGCGGNTVGTGGGGGGTSPNQPTTPGSYTIQVTATSGNIAHAVTVLVTIQ